VIKLGIGKLLYQDLPKLISIIRHLSSKSRVQSRGISFQLISDNWITKFRARTFNDKEPEMLDWLDENLQDEDVFFDVGANVGIYSIYAALRKPTATIYAFEPEYSNLHNLKQNILENDLKKNISPYSIALDENSGISQLLIQDTTPGAALHTVSKIDLKYTHTGEEVVWREGIATMTLDEFCFLSQVTPNLIKIDVDGTETAILKGGQKTFSSLELRTVYIEVEKDRIECEDILSNYGFVLTAMPSNNQIWKRPR
jgi:FkbM family methyltransferase